jgi:hypothetical protein
VDSEQATESRPGPARIDAIEDLLADKGRNIGFGGVRVAVGRSGIAVGLPNDSIIHFSWLALSAVALVILLVRRRRGT